MESTDLKAEVSKYFEDLDTAIAENKLYLIKSLLNEMQAQDISDYLEEQQDEQLQATLFRLLRKDLAVDVFEHLEFDEQEILINSLKHERVIEILEEMDPDDRTDLFEEMPAEVVNKYIAHLSKEEREVATKLLGYPDYSVGRLMTTDYVAFRPRTTVADALEQLKQLALDKETIYHCYIIDQTRKLLGYVSLKRLLLAESQKQLDEIMNGDVISVSVREDQEEAARLFKHYDLLAMPVVDSENRLVGIATFDDLVDVLEEEATEDIQKMAAILPEEHPYFDIGVFTMAGKRVLWLSILLMAELVSGMVLKGFEASLDAVVGLAFFIPMLMSSGGNTGAQSSSMIIRGLAVGEIRLKHFIRVIGKEMMTGLVLGLLLSLLAFGSAYFLQQDMRLAIVVSLSIIFTVLTAATIGGMLPLLFRALKFDPALMSGPFITTLVDILGLLIYFTTFHFVYT